MNTSLSAFLSVVMISGASGIACAAGDNKISREVVVVFPEQAAVIAPAEIPKLEKEALLGSEETAHRLATYYGMILLNNQKRIYWTQIRMENGDQNARYDLGAFLASEPDKASRIRARYWLNSVVKDGSPYLADLATHTLIDLDNAEASAAKNNP